MKRVFKKIISYASTIFLLRDYLDFKKKMNQDTRFILNFKDSKPCLGEKTVQTEFDRHYVYHTSWAARVLAETKPERHIDISSSLFFAGIVSAFIPVDFYDYRPADLKLSDLKSKEADLMSLPFPDNSLDSLSCMHVVEHIGLGRYGDPIDPIGDQKATTELARVLAANGNLLFVVPVGKTAKIAFNAHRIYSYQTVLNLFTNLTLKEFALIPEGRENGGLIRNADPERLSKENYACGCFLFNKK